MKKFSLALVCCLFFSFIKTQTTYTVNTGSYYYNPANLTINVGDSVVWINDGGFHDVNGNINSITGQPFNNPETFDSPPTSSTGAVIYGHRFTIPGSYNYDCSVGSHAASGMVGSVLVQSVLDTALILHGVIDFDLPSGGATGKAIHLYAVNNITDLSTYGLGVANNGGGTDGQEYTFPQISVTQGAHILLARDTGAMLTYFDSCFSSFDLVLQATNSISQNGDDAIELFENGSIIETFGDPNVDGTGEPWEYQDSWAYKDTNGTVNFSGGMWQMGGVNCSDGSTTTQSSNCPYPLCISTPPPPPPPTNTASITFQVDMSQVVDNFNTPELNGTFNGWCGDCNPMSDADGNEIWEVTLDLNHGDTIEYKFSADAWTIQETNDPSAPCTNGDPTYTNRVLIVPTTDSILLEVCWGSCSICSQPPSFISENIIGFHVYPNPANSVINLISNQNIDKVDIYDMYGKLVSTEKIGAKSYNIDIKDFKNNIYQLACLINNKWYYSKVIIIN